MVRGCGSGARYGHGDYKPASRISVGNTASLTISGATPSGYDGTFECAITGASTFTYSLASNPGPETVAGAWTLVIGVGWSLVGGAVPNNVVIVGNAGPMMFTLNNNSFPIESPASLVLNPPKDGQIIEIIQLQVHVVGVNHTFNDEYFWYIEACRIYRKIIGLDGGSQWGFYSAAPDTSYAPSCSTTNLRQRSITVAQCYGAGIEVDQWNDTDRYDGIYIQLWDNNTIAVDVNSDPYLWKHVSRDISFGPCVVYNDGAPNIAAILGGLSSATLNIAGLRVGPSVFGLQWAGVVTDKSWATGGNSGFIQDATLAAFQATISSISGGVITFTSGGLPYWCTVSNPWQNPPFSGTGTGTVLNGSFIVGDGVPTSQGTTSVSAPTNAATPIGSAVLSFATASVLAGVFAGQAVFDGSIDLGIVLSVNSTTVNLTKPVTSAVANGDLITFSGSVPVSIISSTSSLVYGVSDTTLSLPVSGGPWSVCIYPPGVSPPIGSYNVSFADTGLAMNGGNLRKNPLGEGAALVRIPAGQTSTDLFWDYFMLTIGTPSQGQVMLGAPYPLPLSGGAQVYMDAATASYVRIHVSAVQSADIYVPVTINQSLIV